MNMRHLPIFVVLLLLIWAIYLLWKERNHLHAGKRLLASSVIIFLARFIDGVIEYLLPRFTHTIAQRTLTLNIVDQISDFADALGVLLLVYGFIETIKFEREEEKRIQELELLLPICSNCKKYRTDDNIWMPIEHYLVTNNAQKVTHGICPECAAKMIESLKNL